MFWSCDSLSLRTISAVVKCVCVCDWIWCWIWWIPRWTIYNGIVLIEIHSICWSPGERNDQLKGNIFMLCFCFLNASTWKIVGSLFLFFSLAPWHIRSINHSHFKRTNTTIPIHILNDWTNELVWRRGTTVKKKKKMRVKTTIQ